MSISQKKADEILNYYLLHKKIELIFTQDLNPLYQYLSKNFITSFFTNDDINIRQTFYIVEKNFIQNWKTYVNYSLAKKYLDSIDINNYKTQEEYVSEIKERVENMILTEELNDDSNNQPFMVNYAGFDLRNFIHKIIFSLDDFDALIDEETFKLFSSYEGIDNKNKLYGLIMDKMIVLLIKNERKMKFLIKYNSNLLQLTADFNVEDGETSKKFFSSDEAIQRYEQFYYLLLKNTSDYYINEFIKQGILINDLIILKSSKNKNICKLKNDTLFKTKTFSYNNDNINNNFNSNKFNEVNIAKFTGLANIGATCYMNATLQNLINTDLLTRYLLTEKNYNFIMSDQNNFELCSKYCELLYNTCINDLPNKYYEPKNFKEIISRKNPLFEGVQACDSKDLVNFLLEEMHNELKRLENNKDDNFYGAFQPNQFNQVMILNNFKKFMNENNKSIISKLFYILVESITHCQRCNNDNYNYEVTFYIEFPLENVYKFCCTKNIPVNFNNKIVIPLLQCFNNYYEPALFTGENQIYCNVCKCQCDAVYKNNLYSFPPILIIVLNRGKGNIFHCEVDIPFNLNLKNYCKNFEGNVNYQLKGLITHLGPSGMSGHFIAYCRHRITNEWYCYNDAVVTKLDDQNNGYKKGTPYILFYEGCDNCNNYLYPNVNNNSGFNQNMVINNNNMNFNMYPINSMQNKGWMNNNNFNIYANSFNNNNNINQNFNFNNMNMSMNMNANFNNNINNSMNMMNVNMNNNMNNNMNMMNNNMNINNNFMNNM